MRRRQPALAMTLPWTLLLLGLVLPLPAQDASAEPAPDELATHEAAGDETTDEGEPARKPVAAEQPVDDEAWRQLLVGSWRSDGESTHFFSFGHDGGFSYAVLGPSRLQAHMFGLWRVEEGWLVTTVTESLERDGYRGQTWRDRLELLVDGSLRTIAEDGNITCLSPYHGWY